EVYKLQVAQVSASITGQPQTVSGGGVRISAAPVVPRGPACRQYGNRGLYLQHFLLFKKVSGGAPAVSIIAEQLKNEGLFGNGDIFFRPYLLCQKLDEGFTRRGSVGVKNSPVGMTTFKAQVKTIINLIKLHSGINNPMHLLSPLSDQQVHGLRIAKASPGDKRIFFMALKGIRLFKNGSYTSLRPVAAAILQAVFCK